MDIKRGCAFQPDLRKEDFWKSRYNTGRLPVTEMEIPTSGISLISDVHISLQLN
jgi:hypothetical protein